MELTTSEETTTVDATAETLNGAENPRRATKSHRIDLEPAYRTDPETGRSTGHGKAVMVYEGEVIGASREPAFAAARWLLKRGLAIESDRLTTWRNGSPALFTIVGRAAKLTVQENAKGGLTIRAYREFPTETREKALREIEAATV